LKGHIVSDVTRAKIGAANRISLKGHKQSAASKAAHSASKKGKPWTEAQRDARVSYVKRTEKERAATKGKNLKRVDWVNLRRAQATANAAQWEREEEELRKSGRFQTFW
jgi:hypothetical protein